MPYDRKRRFLNIMPPFIAYGVGVGLNNPLACGVATILAPNVDVDRFDKLIHRYKPSYLACAPQHYEALANSQRFGKEDMSYLVCPWVGGDKLSPALEEKLDGFLRAHNAPYGILKGYGMTEVSATASLCFKDINAVGSAGIPQVHNTIAAFEPGTCKELTYRQPGEICITGPTVMLGYLGREKETRQIVQTHNDGQKWVHSGDIGYVSEDGYVYVIDRMKRMIIRPDGFKVYPSVIENAITKHDGVKSCAVIGVPCAGFTQGIVPKAYVVLKKEAVEPPDATLAAIKDLCHNELAEYAQPEEYEIIDKLPLTPIGKVDYRALE